MMEAIELLFVAWFMEQNDIKCAEDAMKIYQFVQKNIKSLRRRKQSFNSRFLLIWIIF